MKSKKHIGSYYTPEFLSKFIVRYLAPNFTGKTFLSILEPSVGDGIFIKAFNETVFPNSIKNFSFQCVEKYKPELIKAKVQAYKEKKKNYNFSFTKTDFLKYQQKTTQKFSFVVGNPPYIKKSLLNETQINLCKSIHSKASLPDTTVKNIWASFLIACTKLLTPDGILAFVLPAELLQVKFSNALRKYLGEQYERIETFTFDELMFNQIGQDTIILICFKRSANKGQFYTHIKNRLQLEKKTFTLSRNEPLVKSEIKWTHHTLTSEEITLLVNIQKKCELVTKYCNSKPGIVTAANKYFIINEELETKYGLKQFTKPIIQKGLFVNGSVVFDKDSLGEILEDNKPTKLICLPEMNEQFFNPQIRNYLEIGKELLIDNRYKCLRRNYWYVIPNIEFPPEGFFFRRCHHYPKILKNEANILVTDSAYKIEMKNQYNIETLIYSFYNSLTLSFAEIEGRYYGGGVLELTPSEFKKLPIPYSIISEDEFKLFRKAFENKSEIEEVLRLYDYKILNKAFNLSSEEIDKLHFIRKKLIAKRFRK